MKSMKRAFATIMVLSLLISLFSVISTLNAGASSDYDSLVLSDGPVAYFLSSFADTADSSGNSLNGAYYGDATTSTTLPNGDTANRFNGSNNYFEIQDHDLLEITTTGILTIEAWMRPDVLQFPNWEGSGYVHWMGKGEGDGTTGQQSWLARMYNYTNQENRPNRISGYAFNPEGGLGAGSYFQDPINTTDWIQYTLVINTVDTSDTYPTGYTKIFKNGVLRDQDSLIGYNIIPENTTAPTRIGTQDLDSFLQGSVGKVAIYDYELTERQLVAHYNKMFNLSSDYLAYEDFDNEAVGNLPKNFSVIAYENTSATVSDEASASTAHSLKLVDSNSSGSIKVERTFITTDKPRIEMKIKSAGEWVEFHTIGGSNYISRLYFKNDGRLYYYNGSYNYLADFNQSSWNDLKIDYDPETMTMEVTLNGQVVGNSIPYYTAVTDINKIRINTGTTANATGIYIDDIGISEVVPEPVNYIINGDFESGSLPPWTGSKVFVESGIQYEGSNGLRIRKGGVVEQEVTGLTPNTQYVMEAYVKSESAATSTDISIREYGGSEQTIQVYDTVYTQITVPFTTGPSDTSVTLAALRSKSAAGSGFMDAVSVTEAP